jgi:uncharacterized protein YcaQ
VRTLSAGQARRITLAAQGLDRRPSGRIDAGHVRRTIERMGVLQLDSVPVVVRSQYLPLFARLGPHRLDLLDRVAYERDRFIESWAHEASLIPVEREPFFRWRQDDHSTSAYYAELDTSPGGYVESVCEEVAARGPLRAGDLSDPRRRTGDGWASRSDGRRALELLFAIGRLSVRRTSSFGRVYDLVERVVPAEILAQPTPARPDALRQLVDWAAEAHGVAAESDIADYWRVTGREIQPLISDLVDAGRLVPVEVEGWGRPAWLHAEARVPRAVNARALLSPFDPIVWYRPRLERVFDFHYRIEIYVPAPKRRWGYYVLPFVQGDRMTARVDLKSDRVESILRVRAVHVEEGAAAGDVAADLAAELRLLADHLGLDDLVVECGRADAVPLRAMVS